MRGMLMVAGALLAMAAPAAPVGQFADHRDIGRPGLPGSARYDPATRTYRVTGGGANMWAAHDDFHFVYRRMSGDVTMETALDFVTPPPAPTAAGYVHRKGGLILRQDLDPDSVYVDALRMGNRQLSLQYRAVKGGQTRLIWINTARQGAVRLEKIGDYAYLFVPGPDGRLRRAGGSFRLRLTGPYYAGLAVCPHDDTTRETMAFRDVRIARRPAGGALPGGSTLQTIQIANPAEQTALFHDAGPIAVAGWSADGGDVFARHAGGVLRARAWDSDVVVPARRAAMLAGPPRTPPVMRGDARLLATRLSPDGRWLAYLQAERAARGQVGASDVTLRLMPVADGVPQRARSIALSQFRGDAASLGPQAWSPDSKTIAFVARD